VASIWLLFVLALLTLLFALVAKDQLLSRHALASRGNQLQASWLARTGVEIAAAHLLDKKDTWKGETFELFPGGKVRVEVKSVKGSGDVFDVVSEGNFPAADARAPRETITRRFRRVVEEGRIRLIPEPAP
jgi:hypothetical protein